MKRDRVGNENSPILQAEGAAFIESLRDEMKLLLAKPPADIKPVDRKRLHFLSDSLTIYDAALNAETWDEWQLMRRMLGRLMADLNQPYDPHVQAMMDAHWKVIEERLNQAPQAPSPDSSSTPQP
jgi:hypothetical protein